MLHPLSFHFTVQQGFLFRKKYICCETIQLEVCIPQKFLDNVCSKKNNTKCSSNTLLRLVFFFSERTLYRVLCLGCFLRLWKNNHVCRKPCKQRSDLVLNGQMRVHTKINRVIQKTMLLENCVSGGMPVIEKHLSATVPHFRILKFHTCWPHTYFFQF